MPFIVHIKMNMHNKTPFIECINLDKIVEDGLFINQSHVNKTGKI